MQIIGPLSLTQHVKDWLGNSSRPRILHVFDRVCNLINERKEVLSVVSQQIGNGPFHLVVETEILFSNDLHVESPISIAGDQLRLGEFVIETVKAQLWDPRPEWEKLHNNRDQVIDEMARFPVPDVRLSDSLISKLSIAFAKADISAAKNVTSKLAGLGVGLTPAGDDFIMGALYAVWIIHPLKAASMLAQEIANTAAPLTTSLSAAWLRSAGRGEAGLLWHQLLATSLAGQTANLTRATEKILAVGATSGADALAGFINTLLVYRELEKKYVIPKFI